MTNVRRVPRGSIWAEDERGVIGDGQGMIWHVPADFRHFKNSTLGSAVIMGRKSFEAIGRPLPGRTNIVITTREDFSATGVTVAHSVEEAFALAEADPTYPDQQMIWVIGGGAIFDQTMDDVDDLVVTYLKFPDGPREAPAKQAPQELVYAPKVDPNVWEVDPTRSDADWRPQSGDALWKVVTYVRK